MVPNQDPNLQPMNCKSNVLPTAPPCHSDLHLSKYVQCRTKVQYTLLDNCVSVVYTTVIQSTGHELHTIICAPKIHLLTYLLTYLMLYLSQLSLLLSVGW